MNRRFEITDDEWERLAALLPSATPSGVAAGVTTATRPAAGA